MENMSIRNVVQRGNQYTDRIESYILTIWYIQYIYHLFSYRIYPITNQNTVRLEGNRVRVERSKSRIQSRQYEVKV